MQSPPGRDGAAPRANRLAASSSPYLLQHRFDPVDWHPWGAEALERARREDRPIFLSVGYSTCHWCHVMQRESFADPEVAERMNRHFVNVKLDREERPDLDEIYMTATQLVTGQGGWPNSVFLTPDLEPFFAGTYFPPEERHGRPSWTMVIAAVAEAWRTRRAELEEHGRDLADGIRRHLEERSLPASAPPPPEIAERALAALGRRFDATWGGFGAAPKFPTPANLWLLGELAGERPEAARMLEATLGAMARGGLYDHLGGGFHRYATDREWRVPHFEKMLYDNGLLLEAYAREFARTGDPEAARVARETAEFLRREMTSPEGAFFAAIDAETAGDEGAYYVWTRAEIEAELGAEDAGFLGPLLGFDGPAFFEGGRWVLHLPAPLADLAARRRMERGDLLRQMAPLRARLLALRERRERPATDDKILAEWNGMAIAGLAVAGRLLGEGALVERAGRAAEFVLDALRPGGGPLRRAWRAGRAGETPAFLGDYAYLVRGLLELAAATDSSWWAERAAELAEEQRRRLGDATGAYFTAAEAPDLLVRSKEVFDGATPAANAVAILNALALAERTGDPAFAEEARRGLAAVAEIAELHPEATRTVAVAARRWHAGSGAAAAAAAGPGEGRAGGRGVAALEAEARTVVDATLDVEPAASGGWAAFRMRLAIRPGWHLQGDRAAEGLTATAVEAAAGDVRNLRFEGGRYLRPVGRAEVVTVFEESAEIRGEVRWSAPASGLRLTFQACDDHRCLPPVTVEVLPGAA